MSTIKQLKEALSKSKLKQLAGEVYFTRGEEYFRSGNVLNLITGDDFASGKVLGTQPYRVHISIKSGKINWSCSCPLGEDGEFCKHCVAVGLAIHEISSISKSKTKSITFVDVEKYLLLLDKRELVKIIIDAAKDSDRVYNKIFIETASKSKDASEVATLKDIIDDTIATDDFISWREMSDYAQKVDDVVEGLRKLLKDGKAESVISLTEYALKMVENVIGQADDSCGELGTILEDLQEIHYDACKSARPNPEDLANRLYKWEMSTDWDTFSGAVKKYSEIFGQEGIAIYRNLAFETWEKLPNLRPGQNKYDTKYNRYRITRIMEDLADLAGDPQQLISIKGKDLSTPHAFLEISKIYEKSGDRVNSLEWAERGLKAFAEESGRELREYVADKYHQLNRSREALNIIWSEFKETTSLSSYELLKKHAEKANAWDSWRNQALQFIRAKRVDATGNKKKPWVDREFVDNSLLVQIFIWEGKVEEAWEEAKNGGCRNELWLELAKRREKRHTLEIMPIYQKKVVYLIESKHKATYVEAAAMLKHMKALMASIEKQSDFEYYVNQLKSAHLRKKNFMKELQNKKLI